MGVRGMIDPATNMPNPFGDSGFDLYRYGLAIIPVGGTDGKVPMVEWKKWTRPSGRKAIEKWRQNFGHKNIGIICHLSNVTVVDIDDAALVSKMVERCGSTPLITKTPSGGFHLWYHHDGEMSVNALDDMKVDIKGVGGFVVVPPSVRPTGPYARQRYEFVTGTWDDLKRLPRVKPGSLPKAEGSKPTSLKAVREGRRNDMLHSVLLRQANHCDSKEDLQDVAETINDDFMPPLPGSEVVGVVNSIWKWKTENRIWTGKEARAVIPMSEWQILAKEPDAHRLDVNKLRRRFDGRFNSSISQQSRTINVSVLGTVTRTNSRLRGIEVD
jgi:Bifunctional DNA primase/polymerase, N-terminal/Primase C terminal 1 (PriCT-1)